jgi:hypothetical protein
LPGCSGMARPGNVGEGCVPLVWGLSIPPALRSASHVGLLVAESGAARASSPGSCEGMPTPRLIPRVAKGRWGSRLWNRSAAARLTGPARHSTPMARLRKQAMTCGRSRIGPGRRPRQGHVPHPVQPILNRPCPRSRSASQAPVREGAPLAGRVRLVPMTTVSLASCEAARQPVAGRDHGRSSRLLSCPRWAHATTTPGSDNRSAGETSLPALASRPRCNRP